MTDIGGLSTLAGDGYSVSSGAKGMGAFSTPQSLASLDSRMAYNKTQGAKDQFAANAALSQGRYDAAAQADAQRNQDNQLAGLQAIAMGADPSSQNMGEYIAAKSRANAARALIGIGQGQQKINADAEQNRAANLGAMAKAQYDSQLDDRKLSLEGAKVAAEQARQDITKYGTVTDPITKEASIAPLSGKDADRAYKVQVRFAERELNPEYKAVVEKFGQVKADQMYLDKLRQAEGSHPQ
jgi:hypothetical protein